MISDENQHKNFKEPQRLHESAKDQLVHAADAIFKPRYEKFFNFNTNSVRELEEFFYPRSTDTQRTKQTCLHVISRLFPHIPVEELSNQIRVNPMPRDLQNFLTQKNCKLYKRMLNYVKSSPQGEWLEEFTKFVMLEYLPNLSQNLKQGVLSMIQDERRGKNPIDLKDLENKTDTQMLLKYGSKVCSYVYWGSLAGLPLETDHLEKT